ncbi:MAG: hypothetical protein ACPGVO_08445 [Spirulinaceae cyanobacterium]
MSTHKLTVELSETVFQQLTQLAQQNQSSPELLAVQSILMLLPADKPEPTASTWEQMQTYSQEQLLTIAQGQVSQFHAARHIELLERNQQGNITPQERLELQDLRLAADRLMLRKAYAWDILGQQGYKMPTLEELRLPE